LRLVPFRVRPGDDASCRNLYAPREPRILGAPRAFLEEGRFSFQRSRARTPAQKQNPWVLLESEQPDGAIPAAADANTMQYILHLGLEDEIAVRGASGTPVRLRLVAALRDSIFQGELLISEANFLRAFAEQEGFRFFLIDAPAQSATELKRSLETLLGPRGFSVESSGERLEAYHEIENTYLSTFQTLGTLGLILGTLCLGAVLLRNTLERRKELALLQAVGYRKPLLAGMILGENLVLLLWGLLCGTASATLAILPALQSRGLGLPPLKVGLVLTAILLAGSISSILAVRTVLRTRLLAGLHAE
jgi:hypothetical protein